MKQTPHINLKDGDSFHKTVLMPGDPLRAGHIAETFLESPVLINSVRGMSAYNGRYKDLPITVMASGMGMPSMGIYAYELFTFFGVENIIRIGSAGAICKELKLRDIIAVQAACTNSNFAAQYSLPGTFAPAATFSLLQKAVQTAEKQNAPLQVGTVLTSDTFYDDSESAMIWEKMGVLAVEMETAALYMTAARCKKKALSLLTVSDRLFDPTEELTAQGRETSLNNMVRLALDTAVSL